MKKILCVILALAICLAFTGCGNMSIGLGNYNYTKVHIDTHNYSGCLTIEKWYDSGNGIEVKTKEAGDIFLSEGTYILLDGTEDCPFCNAHYAEVEC